MKGGVGIILLLLIIVVVIGFLIYQYFKTPSVENNQTIYEKDIIVIDEYEVSDSIVYSGSSSILRFRIKNNGKETVEKVKLNFFDLGGFKSFELSCQKAEKKDSECIFYSLKAGESRDVEIELFPPESVSETLETRVSFSVEYDISRKVRATIPIIDKSLLNKPLAKFSSTQFGNGPVTFEFKLSETDFGEKGKPFKVEMIVKDVGTYENKQTVKIHAGNIVLVPYKISKTTPCPYFDDSYKSTKELLLNPSDSLYCFFKSEDFEGSELDALLEATYNYTYTFFKTQSFKIKPMG
ncbi:MAG: hypothetical protein QXQ77_02285 [Candidatus Aenigmatarchaeota archaeon]